jgi:hypothetical protein
MKLIQNHTVRATMNQSASTKADGQMKNMTNSWKHSRYLGRTGVKSISILELGLVHRLDPMRRSTSTSYSKMGHLKHN